MESILIIVIPVLILMGHYLALVSDRLRLDAYSKHVVAEVDRLNSFLENDVKSNNLLKNFGFVFLISLLLFWTRYRLDNLYIFQWACGSLLIIPLRINSLHLSNIFIFRFVRDNPDEIKGQITQSAKYICTLAAARDFAFLIAIAPMALLSRSFYLYGALTGDVIMPVTNFRWYRRYKKDTAVSSDSVTTRKKSGLVSKIIGRFFLIVAIAFLIAHEGYQFYLNKTYSKV